MVHIQDIAMIPGPILFGVAKYYLPKFEELIARWYVAVVPPMVKTVVVPQFVPVVFPNAVPAATQQSVPKRS